VEAKKVDNHHAEHRILEQISMAILLFDHQLHLVYINPAAEMLLAVGAKHVLYQSLQHLVPYLGIINFADKLSLALNQGSAFTEREIMLTLHNGQKITINCSVTPVNQINTQTEVMVEMCQIDRQVKMNRDEHLWSQHQATKTLLRNLAHEIQNPLGGLRGAAQLLERELSDPSLQEYTSIIIAEADRLQTLLSKMLGSNRLPNRQAINIHQILERVISLVIAEMPQIQVQRDYDPSIPLLHTDADQMIQAILNLARNGAQAAGTNGHLTLRTRVLRQFTINGLRHSLVLHVSIEDDGPGIPKNLQDKIFLPLVSGKHGGTGLGLAIAQDLVNQHGGVIEYATKQDTTIFSVYLPINGYLLKNCVDTH
jgi:two-component system nitrogen regulation sensor histidine kinase GlnL